MSRRLGATRSSCHDSSYSTEQFEFKIFVRRGNAAQRARGRVRMCRARPGGCTRWRGASDRPRRIRFVERGAGTHLAATGSLALASRADLAVSTFGSGYSDFRTRSCSRGHMLASSASGSMRVERNRHFVLAKTVISTPVRRFLRQDIASSECLSVLLLMRQHADRWWEAQNVADALDIAADTAQAALERLSARNLLDVRLAGSLTYCYHPGTDSLASLVDDVARLHAADRGVVFDLVAGPRRVPPCSARRSRTGGPRPMASSRHYSCGRLRVACRLARMCAASRESVWTISAADMIGRPSPTRSNSGSSARHRTRITD